MSNPAGMPRRVAILLAVVAVLGGGMSGLQANGPASCVPRTRPVGNYLREIRRTPVVGRIFEVTLDSRAAGRLVTVRVQLPVGYDKEPKRRYPVLYLLHGKGGSHAMSGWIDSPAAVGNAPLIVVFPDGGADGWYSDWAGTREGSEAGTPGWESHHIRELVPWVDRALRTVRGRTGRAIAGISMGGYGALAYAARHPDLFAAAGSFSGVVHLDHAFPVAARYLADSRIVGDECVWGSWQRRRDRWQAHDPTMLAQNLTGVGVFLTSRTGVPVGDEDPRGASTASVQLEHTIWQMNRALSARLDVLGVPHYKDLDGPGTHQLRYWRAALKAFVPWLMSHLATLAPPAPRVRFLTGEASATAWGWTLRRTGDVRDFVRISDAGPDGFRLDGTRRIVVTTPRAYAPRSRHVVTVAGTPYDVRADSVGRLTITVDFAPPITTRPPVLGADYGTGVRVSIA